MNRCGSAVVFFPTFALQYPTLPPPPLPQPPPWYSLHQRMSATLDPGS